MYKVGIYLRLSREDEKLGESESISVQREMILNYIKDNKLEFIDEYVDDGVSGTTFDRDGFKRMIRDCKDKRINMIITKDTSRLGRDHIEFGYYVERFFPENNIRYVAINDGIDTFSNNSANDMLVFKSAFNDMYVKDISNKLKSSLYTKKRNGLFVGCYAPYGYKKSIKDKHKLEIDYEVVDVVKRIFEMFVRGNSINMISDTLTYEHIPTPSMYKNMKLGQDSVHYGIWSTRTISDILRNPTYVGDLAQCRQKKVNYKSKKRVHNDFKDWIIAKGAVEGIIDKNTFDLVQVMFNSNKNHRNNSMMNNLLLRGLIYCKECGHTIGFRNSGNRIYGNCNYWIKRRKQNVCSPHSVKYQVIEDLVLDNLRYLLDNINIRELVNIIKNTLDNSDNIKKEIVRLEQSINNISKKIDICYNDKLEGNITLDMYKRIYNDLNIDIKNLENKKREYEKKIMDKEYDNYKIKELIDKPSRVLISSLIEKIVIDEDRNIDIYYRFSETLESYSSDSVSK